MFFLLFFFVVVFFYIEIPLFDAKSVDYTQMPHFAKSDLGLHYLKISLL